MSGISLCRMMKCSNVSDKAARVYWHCLCHLNVTYAVGLICLFCTAIVPLFSAASRSVASVCAHCLSGRCLADIQAIILEKWSTSDIRRLMSPNIPVCSVETEGNCRLESKQPQAQANKCSRDVCLFCILYFFNVWAFWLHLKWLRKRNNLHCILINRRLICKHHKANWKSSLKVVENIWRSIWCLLLLLSWVNPVLNRIFVHTAATCWFRRADTKGSVLTNDRRISPFSPSLINLTAQKSTVTQFRPISKQIVENNACYLSCALAEHLWKSILSHLVDSQGFLNSTTYSK